MRLYHIEIVVSTLKYFTKEYKESHIFHFVSKSFYKYSLWKAIGLKIESMLIQWYNENFSYTTTFKHALTRYLVLIARGSVS